MKIVFVTTDWMKYYVGEGDEEKVTPLCGYNFQNVNGHYYGYGQGLDEIAIENIEGVTIEDEKVEGVTVVWLAPNKEGETCIIGWYKDATVYRHAVKEYVLDSERVERAYSIVGKAEKALLLPMEERRFVVSEVVPPITMDMDRTRASELAAYIHNYAGDQMNVVLLQNHLEGMLSINMDYERYFHKADEFLAKDAYAKAIRCFNKAIHEEPEETIGYECKASVLLSLKMYDPAEVLYQKVLNLDEDADLAHYCLGFIYGAKKEYEQSLAHYTMYLEKRPEDGHARAECALVYLMSGDKERALENIEQADKLDRKNPAIKGIYKTILKAN
ncbi:MAG: tetratricopeptide repeat protein [Cellulosilyticaceae bacterium]